MIGKKLGRYEILAHLGAGGMGEVYRAKDADLGRMVALKLLPQASQTDPERLHRFEHEARAASALNHPNIVTIYEIGYEDGVPFIAMELVEGNTLRVLLNRRPFLNKRALALAAQAAEGLAKAHAAGIVHRDLKPENIMVTTDGFVKILDFGLAKLQESGIFTSDDATTSPATRPGVVLGTVGYMSPEQARGKALDFRSDQFACGAILYEMATGKRAFDRETAFQTLAAIMDAEPEPIQNINPEVPAPFRWIVERCLKKNPEERYASTLDLARELRTVHDRLEEMSSGPRSSPTIQPRRHPWLQSTSIAAALALAVAAGTLWRPPPALPAAKHIAVLPFANAGGDVATQAFCNGLVETLTSRLTQLERFQGALWVVPASEVRQASVASAAAAHSAFGATLAVSGSVQRSGDVVKLTANLVDAVSLRQIRSLSLDSSIADLAIIQDGVVRRVAEMLELELAPEARRVLEAGGTKVATAYDAYLQGRGHLQRYQERESLERATGAFQDALQRDPTFALAYAGLGEAEWRLYDLTKDRTYVDLARKACERALSLNDLLAPVHVTVGLLHIGTGDAERATSDFQRALALDPASSEARRGMAQAYEALARTAEAEAEYRKAVALKPDYWGTYSSLGRFFMRQGRYQDAEQAYRRVVELVPDNERGHSNLGALLLTIGRYDEARAALQRSLAIRPTFAAASNLATVEFRRGRYAEAARAFERALALDDRDYRIWRNLAAAQYWAGERGLALDAYRKAAGRAEAARALNPQNAEAQIALADCHAMLGDAKQARALATEALHQAPRDVQIIQTAVGVYEQLGDRDTALRWLQEALKLGFPRDNFERSPTLTELRKDPRYSALAGSRDVTTERSEGRR